MLNYLLDEAEAEVILVMREDWMTPSYIRDRAGRIKLEARIKTATLTAQEPVVWHHLLETEHREQHVDPNSSRPLEAQDFADAVGEPN